MTWNAVANRLASMAATIMVSSVILSGCATPTGGVTDPSPSESGEATPIVTESPSPSPSPSSVEPPASPSPSPSPTADAVQDVTVVLITLDVIDGVIESSGMVTDVVEDGGECVLTLRQGTDSRTAAGSASPGTETTYCGLITVPAGELAPGEWLATLTYTSPAHHGVSDVETVRVP